jgi:hypothetical protein
MRWYFLVFVVGCGGPAFESASSAISPGDGDLSKDSPTGLDSARDSGLDAAPGEFGGDAGPPTDDASSEGTSDHMSPPLDSHVTDPWPADVVVEPMPAPNCLRIYWGTGPYGCCGSRNTQAPNYGACSGVVSHCDWCPEADR